jgi:hypothetical protein
MCHSLYYSNSPLIRTLIKKWSYERGGLSWGQFNSSVSEFLPDMSGTTAPWYQKVK